MAPGSGETSASNPRRPLASRSGSTPEAIDMRDLRLVSISEDRLHVVLRADDTGEQFRVAAHDLRSALRGERARLGQLESHMDSALRPRDIPARTRAGAARAAGA